MSERLDSAVEQSADIVIIGGGVIGLSIAFHLARLGVTDVELLERNQLTSGTSWHAAGIVGPLRASASLTALGVYATELFPQLEALTGQSVGYRTSGGMWLARTVDRLRELRRIQARAQMDGLSAYMLDAAAIASRIPEMNTTDLAGALWVDEDAQANPVDICMAYARGARAAGVRIREGARCIGIERRASGVSAVALAGGERIACSKVVNCAGAWAGSVGAMAGVPIPLQPVQHMYVVTDAVPDMTQPFPVVRDIDAGIYIKGDVGRLVLGGFEAQAKLWDPQGPDADRPFLELPEEWDHFEPFMRAGLARLPLLEEVGITHFMNGPESFTPDTAPLMGESPYLPGFYVAAGFNSTGMMSSAGVGKAMAQWLVDGEAPMDLWDVDVARFDRRFACGDYLARRIPEAVGEVFQMHWPGQQHQAARNLRESPLHNRLRDAGAVFGAPAGWERPLWFAHEPRERSLGYSYGDQSWWPAAERESLALRDNVGLFDLTPFSKFRVSGRDALPLMQYLCACDLDIAVDRACYTQMLNARGGIEADVTVVRVDEHSFQIVGGAASRRKDFAWMTRAKQRLGADVAISDVTAEQAVLGVMGPASRALLQALTTDDLCNARFPFLTSRCIEIAGLPVRATRLSFVGELGYEVYVGAEFAERLYQAVQEQGRALGLRHCGLYALDACRMEKAYRHWGHDLGSHDSPLQAGTSFAVSWDKTTPFLGRDALLRQRDDGTQRRLAHFLVVDAHPLLLHDEPLYCDGMLVGRTTSGARGFRTDRSLCLGYVSCQPGQTLPELAQRRFEIQIEAQRYPLELLLKPPYDPAGRRLRG